MGGTKDKNDLDRRIIESDALLWNAAIELIEQYPDRLPVTAYEVAIKAGKKNSVAMITRDRGGLEQMHRDLRNRLCSALSDLVDSESEKHGKIDLGFCRRLAMIIADYYVLFKLDVASDSHRNTKCALEVLSPLIHERNSLYFAAEYYQLLTEWSETGFSRDLILARIEKQLQAIFWKHQITRPDMNIIGAENE